MGNHTMIAGLGNLFVALNVDIALNSQQLCMKSCFRNDNKPLFTQSLIEVFYFSLTFYSKFCLPNHFLFGATPPPGPL